MRYRLRLKKGFRWQRNLKARQSLLHNGPLIPAVAPRPRYINNNRIVGKTWRAFYRRVNAKYPLAIMLFLTTGASWAQPFMFCYATEPVAGTNLVFVSNFYRTQMDTQAAAADYQDHAASDGYDLLFKCITNSSLVALSVAIMPVLNDFLDRGLQTAEVKHP